MLAAMTNGFTGDLRRALPSAAATARCQVCDWNLCIKFDAGLIYDIEKCGMEQLMGQVCVDEGLRHLEL